MNRRKQKKAAHERTAFCLLLCAYCLLASGPGGIRTLDLLNAIETRSQLRYGPSVSKQAAEGRRQKLEPLSAYCFVPAAYWQVDLEGFEPSTFSVRLRRAPNCATGPPVG